MRVECPVCQTAYKLNPGSILASGGAIVQECNTRFA